MSVHEQLKQLARSLTRNLSIVKLGVNPCEHCRLQQCLYIRSTTAYIRYHVDRVVNAALSV